MVRKLKCPTDSLLRRTDIGAVPESGQQSYMSSVTPDAIGSARKKITATLARREIVTLVLVGN
jgi:hypothetical protein